jgi:hypothetical protein
MKVDTFRSFAVGVLVAAAIVALQPAVPASALPPPGPGVPIWAPDWMKNGSGNTNWDPGRTLALRQARTFDIVIAHSTTYDNYVSAMVGVNPDVRIFVYVQGMFSSDGRLPSSWYAHSLAGNRIRSEEFGTYLMNPKSSGWRDSVLRTCTSKLRASHYHGCFIDSLGPTGVNDESVTALPKNPSTGRVYTRRQWLDATKVIAAHVETAMAPRPTLANGLVDGPGYVNAQGPTERLLDGCTAGMMEAFMRASRWRVSDYKGETAWRQDVNALTDAANRSQGSIVLAVTKVWTDATAAQIAQWHRYALGSFLLGYKPGHAYFTFRSDHNLSSSSPGWNVNLGAPSGSYIRTSNGLYVRNFTKGKVVVNPGTTSRSLKLDDKYLDLSGTVRATGSSLGLAKHTAQILTRV